MWAVMEAAQPSVFAESNLKGVERVLRGGYAYLMESTTIEYLVQKNCQLTQIGGPLDSKGYGIATPPGENFSLVRSKTYNASQQVRLYVQTPL